MHINIQVPGNTSPLHKKCEMVTWNYLNQSGGRYKYVSPQVELETGKPDLFTLNEKAQNTSEGYTFVTSMFEIKPDKAGVRELPNNYNIGYDVEGPDEKTVVVPEDALSGAKEVLPEGWNLAYITFKNGNRDNVPTGFHWEKEPSYGPRKDPPKYEGDEFEYVKNKILRYYYSYYDNKVSSVKFGPTPNEFLRRLLEILRRWFDLS